MTTTSNPTNVSTPLPIGEGQGERLLLLRFSALGDILMTVPIVEQLARQYPEMQITMVSRPFVKSIFELLPKNVHFVGINPRNYHGLSGLGQMYKELRALRPTLVCDLHDVLRTKYLRLRFRLSGLPTSHIVKDRAARKRFIKAAVKTQQETSFERYEKALQRLLPDFKVTPPSIKGSNPLVELSTSLNPQPSPLNSHPSPLTSRIGIAPFAAHQGKVYPLEKMERVVMLLSSQGSKVYLFGAGEQEKTLMEAWEKKYEGVESVVGKLPDMAAELKLMSTLDAMLTMDSGNMHLAALCGVRVVSVWGATHPLGGFLGWGLGLDNVIQQDLPCRPCSTFGNKPCKWGDYRCLNSIEPEEIMAKVTSKK